MRVTIPRRPAARPALAQVAWRARTGLSVLQFRPDGLRPPNFHQPARLSQIGGHDRRRWRLFWRGATLPQGPTLDAQPLVLRVARARTDLSAARRRAPGRRGDRLRGAY